MLPPVTPSQRLGRAVQQTAPGVKGGVRSSSPPRAKRVSAQQARRAPVTVTTEADKPADPGEAGQLFFVTDASCP